MGIRYKNYCSNIVRTILVEPSDKISDLYKYLLALEENLIDNLYDGMANWLSNLFSGKLKTRKFFAFARKESNYAIFMKEYGTKYKTKNPSLSIS